MTRFACTFIATLAIYVAPQPSRAVIICYPQDTVTLSEEIQSSDIAIIGELLTRPEPDLPSDAPIEAHECKFEIISTLKGIEHLAQFAGDANAKTVKIPYFGDRPVGTRFLVFGIDPADPAWGSPVPVNNRSIDYVTRLLALPGDASQRLAFFLPYLADEDPLTAIDAHDEFNKAPFASMRPLQDRLPREQLLAWSGDKTRSVGRRRLYLRMLSLCGKPEDVPLLEAMIQDNDHDARRALDAQIGCYLTLAGAAGLPLIENMFLKNDKAEYTDTYSAIMALRFVGQETDAIPPERLLEGFRLMLARPKLADLVVPDLQRMHDWSAMPRVGELFKTADEDSHWIRVPVANYLLACPAPEASVHLEELEKLDPEAIRRSRLFFQNSKPSP